MAAATAAQKLIRQLHACSSWASLSVPRGALVLLTGRALQVRIAGFSALQIATIHKCIVAMTSYQPCIHPHPFSLCHSSHMAAADGITASHPGRTGAYVRQSLAGRTWNERHTDFFLHTQGPHQSCLTGLLNRLWTWCFHCTFPADCV